jgi:2-polyprenyl-6-methoxyphenol hydroxylase-like FAD-dependent oxidoreductase
MATRKTDIVIVGAGPVGLMCAYLGRKCGLDVVIADKSSGPLEVGRADALNARTLQLMELAGLFDELYPLGKPCNTSSVWSEGKFVSRQSAWWDSLEGCFHKHFLMLGQAYVEKALDRHLTELGESVLRSREVTAIEVGAAGPVVTLSGGERIEARYLIGADGSRSFVRSHFEVPFEIVRPQIIWAVIDGVLDTDFPKVPEIIVFQAETSDVAWIPREGEIDRFYVRMDTKEFTLEDTVEKINRAMRPHSLRFKTVDWFSQFAVKESVAKSYFLEDCVFLAGDACHIHSVNGGQGLNTGLADAFNLMWKLSMVLNHGAPSGLLRSYESERKPVAQKVIESSGELVRATKFSKEGTHALDYVKIVQKYAGNITGMGVRYGEEGLAGSRLFDLEVLRANEKTRLYFLLDYTKFTLLLFGDGGPQLESTEILKVIRILPNNGELRCSDPRYANQAILVRPDSYIDSVAPLADASILWKERSS